MKFTLSWLKEHLETGKSLAEIADAMTMAGLEIEHIDNPADRLAAFTVAADDHAFVPHGNPSHTDAMAAHSTHAAAASSTRPVPA